MNILSSNSFALMRILEISEWDQSLKDWLESAGVTKGWAIIFADLCWFFLLLLLAWIVYFIALKITVKVGEKTFSRIGKTLVASKFFKRLCYFIPLAIISMNIAAVWSDFPKLVKLLDRIVGIMFVVVFISTMNAIAHTIINLNQYTDSGRQKPIKSLVQFAQMIIYFISIIIIISVFFGKPPAALIGGLGAMSAVLMLIFKDSILGLVASVQLSTNNMVNIGDWITIPKYGIDGDVLDITLTTVKVQNWDKTISTVPTYALISDTVVNWKGMTAAGGRRIARSINIDMRSVQFCTDEMLERFKKIAYIEDYVNNVQDSLNEYNKSHSFDMSVSGNGIRQTNLGIFRAYLTAYLRNHPDINQELTLMIRQLAPTDNGIPLQIYCFTQTTSWEPYEKVQADIFEYLLGVLPHFDLRVYQNVSGSDVSKAITA